jgi:hypothetical protein
MRAQIGESEQSREMEVLILFHQAADDLRQGDFGEIRVVL